MFNILRKKPNTKRKWIHVKQLGTIESVIAYCQENKLTMESCPYVFTHITLSDYSIIEQINEQFNIFVSPVKLRDAFLANQLFSQNYK